MRQNKQNKGFTLLELLLVIAAIGILAAIVLVAINPNRQLAQARNLVRQSDINTIQKALEQYLIDNGKYPNSLSSTPGYICNTGTEQTGGSTNCSGRIDLRELVPTYLAAIPKDPQSTGTNTGYIVAINLDNDKVSLKSDLAENKSISINELGIVKDGLVFHLDAGNTASYSGTGNTWFDLSGNNNNGTLINGVGYSGDNQGSLVFDGIDDKISCGTGSLNNLSAFSGLMWIYKTGVGFGGDRLLTKRSSTQDSGWWDFLTLSNHAISFNADFLTTDITRESSTTFALNTWNMVAFTWDGTSSASNIKLYINANETSYSTSTNGVDGRVTETTNNLVVGNADWANRPFRGRVGVVQVYNRVLTPVEIQQNYNAKRGRFGL
jgi:prepilin-type N-terminal cleavage/methylation domain-containing protein